MVRKIAKDETPYSQQQLDILSWFDGTHPLSKQNLAIRARAGTGKTHTVLRGVYLSDATSVRMLAFGKRIANELQDKIAKKRYGGGGRVKAGTLHAYGYRYFYENRDVVEKRDGTSEVVVDNYRDSRILDGMLGDDPVAGLDNRTSKNALLELVSKAKQMAPLVGTVAENFQADIEQLVAISFEFGCGVTPEGINYGFTREIAAKTAMDVMARSVKVLDGTCTNDDQIFLPLRRGWVRPVYDLIVIDECQDMNTAQLEMAMRMAAGRIAIVGDDRQAIYKFRGADVNALDRLKERLNAVEMPLTVTRRCGKNIVEYVKPWVPDFEAPADMHVGNVIEDCVLADIFTNVRPGDYVLSRTNAPLVNIAFTLLAKQQPVRILGRDGMKAAFVKHIQKMQAGNIPVLKQKLDIWYREADNKLFLAGSSESARQQLLDKHQFLVGLADCCTSMGDLFEKLNKLLVDDSDQLNASEYIACSSVHQAKGLEADRVFLLENTLFLPKGDPQEEENIAYVAATRAKQWLFMVTIPR